MVTRARSDIFRAKSAKDILDKSSLTRSGRTELVPRVLTYLFLPLAPQGRVGEDPGNEVGVRPCSLCSAPPPLRKNRIFPCTEDRKLFEGTKISEPNEFDFNGCK